MPITGNSIVALVAYYPGSPVGVGTSVLEIPKGTLVIDTTNAALYQKTSTTDNSTFNQFTNVTGGTITLPTIADGLLATGSVSNDFSGSTGTFKTSSGANQLSGAVTVTAATTPSITTAAGKTNSGFISTLGKTSGGIKILPADTSGFLITVTNATQTSGVTTLTIPDFAGVADTFVFTTLAQTLASKTLTAPVINGATSASGNFDLSGSSGTTKTSSGLTTVTGPLAGGTPQALSGAGAVNTTTLSTVLTTTGANALTLADGTNAQIKTIVMAVDGGDGTLTPTTKTGFSTIVFNDIGDGVILQFFTTIGWIVIGSFGVTIS